MLRSPRRRQRRPALPRILVHVVHYFGAGSEFEGQSTRSDPEERRAKVERVVDALRAAPYDVDVAVCGIPTAALVPVDVDLSGAVSDPRHLVYAAIEALADRLDDGGYEYFMCVEDDVLVPPDVIDRMIGFHRHSRVNEVFLPNRLEERAGGPPYCVDLLATPGWLDLSRRYDGMVLDVARNPHSGLAFLSRPQLRYAARRVDLARRDQFHGGFMASAFANLHLPFLVWRARQDLEAHSVLHLDPWVRPAGRTSFPGAELGARVEGATGTLDEVVLDGVVGRVRGWLLPSDAPRASFTSFTLAGEPVPGATFSVEERPDVAAAVPGASAECGFVVRFSVLDLTDAQLWSQEIVLRTTSSSITAAWPAHGAAIAKACAPEIPDEPHMPSAAEHRLRGLLKTASCYLEYGTGGSTMLAARIGVPVSYCVESDESWLRALEHRLRAVEAGGRHVLIHADIGPTGEWGYAISTPTDASAADYALGVWRRMEDDEAPAPDVVLIDGRYRVSCFLATLLHAGRATTILFDDYLDRPHYSVVEEAAGVPRTTHDRVAEFVVPDDLDRERVWRLLVRHAADPR